MMQISQFSADPGQETFLAINSPQLDDFCRICLLRKPTLHLLTSQLTPVMILEMLYKITGTMINMQEPMPRVICDRCLLKLDVAYNIAEEFCKQEETLRRFWWKGGLVEQLVEYQGTEESRQKLYSEEVLERLAGERVVPSDLADLEEEFEMVVSEEFLPVQEAEPIDATEFTIKVLPDEAFDELAEELRSPEPDEGVNDVIDNGLEMVLELVDLRTIGALPAEVEEQLLKQEVLGVSSDEGDVDYVPSPEDFGAQIDLYAALEEESDNVDEDDDRDEDFDPRQSRVSPRKARSNKSRYVEDTSDSNDGETDGGDLGNEQNVCDVDLSAKISISTKDYWFQKGSFKCPECSETFRTRFSLRRHYRRHVIVQNGNVRSDVPVEPAPAPEPNTEENNLEDFMCKYCKRPFQYRSALIKHVLQHEKLIADKGSESQVKEQEVRDNRPKIKLPIKIVVNDATHYKCRECGISFETQTGFWKHARQHAATKKGQFQCPDCGKRFSYRKNLRQHQLTAHNLFIKPENEQTSTKYHCTKCDTFFSTGRHFLIHERGHLDATSGESSTPTNDPKVTNEDGQSSWVCVECDSNFSSFRTYMAHQRGHKNLVNVRFKCEICKMAFDSKYPLMKHCEDKHRLPHIPPNMKECYICGKKVKKFIFGGHMKMHEYREMRKYVCKLCDMAFGNYSHMKVHEVRKSCQKQKERPNYLKLQQQDGTFKCYECQGTYPSQNSLVKHMKRHQNIKEGRFRCEPCAKIFSSKSDLKLHVRRRHT